MSSTSGFIEIVLSNSSLDVQWSTTHGFFIIMGGLHFFEHSSEETSNFRKISREDDKPLHPLRADDLVDCDGYESFIMPTKAEIQDKGKGDWFAKSLVLLQTSWFVMQCIARAVSHLPVTHLEIVTLAYAAMNFVMYIFWWNKPLNVNRPVRVFRKSKGRELVMTNSIRGLFQPPVNEPTSVERKLTWETIGNDLGTLLMLILGAQDEDVNLSGEDQVPRFWADDQGGQFAIANFIVLGVGVCFGAIHCIAWLFSFPTHTELLIWRISCVAITGLPIYITLGYFLAGLLGGLMHSEKLFIAITFFVLLPGSILYILARAVTLALAFISLRDLPSGAYETVNWTTYIPHI